MVGPNGAGKSTLLKGLPGELAPLEGRIDRGVARLAYLPRASEVDRSFPIAVGAFVAMGLWHRIGAFGRVSGKDSARVAEALAAVGLTGFERRPISALSGGQVQRVMFARLLLQDADLILLDEPFHCARYQDRADFWPSCSAGMARGEPCSPCCMTSKRAQALSRTLLLAREKVAHGATESVLTAENLFRARQMSEAFDDSANVCVRPATRGAA